MRSNETLTGKTLIVAPSWVGDAVMSQPLLARLAERGAGPIDVLAPKWVQPIYHRMPQVAETLDNPFGHGALALNERWRLGRTLAKRGYRNAVVLPNSLKSALVPFLAGIPLRVGFVGEARVGLLNRRHTLVPKQLPLMVERFAQLAEARGTPPAQPIPNPRLTSTTEQQTDCLDRHQLQRPERLAILCPGAEYGPAKRWPIEHFAALARRLAADGYVVWALGSGKDAAVGDAIVEASGNTCVNLCGKTSLADAVDLLAMSQIVFTNDSGLMHVAAAVGTPLVAFFGSSSPGFTPPLTDRAAVLSLGLPCSPCFKRECPLGHLDCLQKLTPDAALQAAQRLLAAG